MIEIYISSSSIENPGVGSYSAIVNYEDLLETKEFTGCFRLTTNNRMEIMASIIALESIKTKKEIVRIFSNSKYLVNSVSYGLINQWSENGFKGRVNGDLWEILLEALKRQKVRFTWIKTGLACEYGKHCNFLAKEAVLNPNKLEIDYGYESENVCERCHNDMFVSNCCNSEFRYKLGERTCTNCGIYCNYLTCPDCNMDNRKHESREVRRQVI